MNTGVPRWFSGSPAEWSLLAELVPSDRLAALARWQGSPAEQEPLLEVVDVLADRLAEIGLDDTSEPNRIGLRIESLIDRLCEGA